MDIKIVDQAAVQQYDLRGIEIDLTRKTGVLIRQSHKGADKDARESRLRQESLVPIAVQLRGDPDDSNIVLYDEGSGVSGTKGYDERPNLSRLYMDVANSVVGSNVVARADRLFRDKHFRNVSMFTELAEKKRILVIVPGRVIYDFTKTRDLQAFQREMQEAYAYIATQIQYMQDTKQQKVQRGRYGGSNLPAPYVIERSAWKEDQVPVIYHPWQAIAFDLFKRFQEFDFSLARMPRHIEERPFIFPYMSAEDAQRYMFKTRMRQVVGGYTFSKYSSISNYLSNLALGGFAKIGRDAEGSMILLANAHEAAIPMELLVPAYAAIKGHYPDGTPYEGRTLRTRSRTLAPEESPALLHGLLTSDDGSISFAVNRRDQETRPIYRCSASTGTVAGQRFMWCVACEDFDYIIVSRLAEIAAHDSALVDRIQAYWRRKKTAEMNELAVLGKVTKVLPVSVYEGTVPGPPRGAKDFCTPT